MSFRTLEHNYILGILACVITLNLWSQSKPEPYLGPLKQHYHQICEHKTKGKPTSNISTLNSTVCNGLNNEIKEYYPEVPYPAIKKVRIGSVWDCDLSTFQKGETLNLELVQLGGCCPKEDRNCEKCINRSCLMAFGCTKFHMGQEMCVTAPHTGEVNVIPHKGSSALEKVLLGTSRFHPDVIGVDERVLADISPS